MKLTYSLFDPTGNRTILVQTPVPEADQPEIAAKLMELEPETEQVGFYQETNPIRLRMAGGEFCGNATMSAAVLSAEHANAEALDAVISVSGAADPVPASVKKQPEGYWIGTVEMPKPKALTEVLLPGAGTVPVVEFDGIAHVILEQPLPRPLAERSAPAWCEKLGADALGLLFLDKRTGGLTPLVYVPAAGTLCWEKSCASGTTAVGYYLAREQGEPVTATLRQPGGVLKIAADPDGSLMLTGAVRQLDTKTIDI